MDRPTVLKTEETHWPDFRAALQGAARCAPHDPTDPAASTPGRTRVLLIIYALMALAGASIAQFGALMTWVARDLGLTDGQSGLTQTAFFLGYLVGSIATGSAVTWSSARRLVPAMALMIGAGSVLCSVPAFAPILVGRALGGAGLAGAALLATTLICTLFPERRATLLSVMHGVIALAAATTLFTARPLAEALGSWSTPLMSFGLIALAMGAAAAMMPYPPMKRGESASFQEIASAARHPALLAVIPVALGYLFVEQALTMFLPTLAEGHYGANPAFAGALGGVLWLGIIVGRFAAPLLVRQLGEAWIVILGAAVMGFAVIAACCTSDVRAAMVAIGIAGLAGGPIVPMLFSYVSKEVGSRQAAAVTAVQLAICGGGLLGPFLVGTLGQQLGLTTGLVVAAVLVANNVLPLLFAIAPGGQRVAEPA